MPPSALSSTLPSSLPPLFPPKTPLFLPSNPKPNLSFSSSRHRPRFSILSVSTSPPPTLAEVRAKPTPAEVSRTIMELSSSGTLSTLTHDGWPLGVGAQFVVDAAGTPAVCLSDAGRVFAVGSRSSFHVQLEQSRSRTCQCTLIGSLKKPDDGLLLKKLLAKWEKKFGEVVNEDIVHVISVERVLQVEDFKEEGVWVTASEYENAEPDPLRNFAEKIVDEMNSNNAEDVQRLCNIYVDSGFQVTDTKLIWVDRLGFDLYIYSEKGVFAARIPFPREVTDEKGVKSSFNSMSHLAWEIEKSYIAQDFEKVNCLKKIR